MVWPERFQERLHIIAHGEKFDVDAFLASSTLRPHFVWRSEAPLTSGVEFLLGDGRQIRLPDQEEIAVAYLKAHRDELRALGQFPRHRSIYSGLGLCLPVGLHRVCSGTATSAHAARSRYWNIPATTGPSRGVGSSLARPDDEHVRFRFVEEPRCFEVESARNLCAELRSIGKPVVSVDFRVWGGFGPLRREGQHSCPGRSATHR